MKKNTTSQNNKLNSNKTYILYATVLFLFTLLLYSNSIGNDYNLDDELVTRNHPLTSQGLKAIPEIISSPYYKGGGNTYEYRPVVLISFAIEHQFFGESPRTSHFFNVLLYAASILLLFFLLKKLLSGYHILLPFIISLLFAAHPLHTEVVCSIKNRDEILSLFFALSSWYMALRFINQMRYANFAVSGTFFLLALLSKTSALPFAFIIPFSLLYFKNNKPAEVMWLAAILSVIAAFLAPFHNFSHKILLLFLSLCSPFALYFVFCRFHELMGFLNKIKLRIILSESNDSVILLTVKQRWFFIVLSAVFCFTGMFYNLKILFYLTFAGLIVLYFIAGNTEKKYFFTAFMLFVSLVSVNYLHAQILSFCLILILFTYFFIEKRFSLYLILSLLFLIAPWYIWANYEGLTWLLFMTFIFYLVSEKRWRKYGIILMGVFFVSSPALSYIRGMSLFTSGYFVSVIIMGAALLLFFRTRNYRLSSLMLFTIISLALFIRLSSIGDTYSVVVDRYFDPATSITIGADVLPAGGRNLDKVEMPMDIYAPLSIKAGTGLYVTAEYLKKLTLPINMGFYYGYSFIEPTPWHHPQALISLLLHVALFIAALILFKREKLLLFSVLMYFSTIALFSNVVAPLPGLMADRFTYIPSLGFIMLVATALFLIFRSPYTSANSAIKHFRKVLFLCALILILYSGRTFTRNANWENHLSLFRHDIAYLNSSAQAHNLLATNLVIYSAKEKNTQKVLQMKEEAVKHYKEALHIYSDFFNATYDLGRTYYDLEYRLKKPGGFDSALVYFSKAILLKPDFSDPYLQSAFIYHQKSDIDKAVEFYRKTNMIKPDKNAFKNLSVIFSEKNDTKNVLVVNKAYRDAFPQEKEPLVNLARVYYVEKQYDSAAVYFKEILLIDAGDIEAVKALIEVYTSMGNNEQADYYKQKMK